MVIGFVGGSLRSHSCLVLSRSFGNQGVHDGVAKWDFKAQGGQVSRVMIRGLNADISSASQSGGHIWVSVHPPPQSVPPDRRGSVPAPPDPGSAPLHLAPPVLRAGGPGDPCLEGVGRPLAGPLTLVRLASVSRLHSPPPPDSRSIRWPGPALEAASLVGAGELVQVLRRARGSGGSAALPQTALAPLAGLVRRARGSDGVPRHRCRWGGR